MEIAILIVDSILLVMMGIDIVLMWKIDKKNKGE